ncbi:hypothetical protein PLICRDRAFT_175336 [Plicaturopsis crispa FD-325 SS-3]|nr:hypothetical protein PLICRDRAFT_175336 [Plicaturopsis crispa FD-325 SS-3]
MPPKTKPAPAKPAPTESRPRTVSTRSSNGNAHPGQVVIDAGDENGLPLKLRPVPKPRRSQAQIAADEARAEALAASDAAKKARRVKRVAELEDEMAAADAKAKAEASHPPPAPPKNIAQKTARLPVTEADSPTPAPTSRGRTRASSEIAEADEYIPDDDQEMLDEEHDNSDSDTVAVKSKTVKGKGKSTEKAPRGKGPARQLVMAQREEPSSGGTPLAVSASKRKADELTTPTNRQVFFVIGYYLADDSPLSGGKKKSRSATPSGLSASYAPIRMQPRSSSLMSARSTPSSPLSQSMVIDDSPAMDTNEEAEEDLVTGFEEPAGMDPKSVAHIDLRHIAHPVKIVHNRPQDRLSRRSATPASTSKREGSSKFNNSDLPEDTLDEFTRTYVPIAREICGLLPNPWKFTTSPTVLSELQETWTVVVFPDIPHTVSKKNDPVWEVARQRVYEYRSAFGPAAEDAVSAFWPSSGMDTDAKRAEFVDWAVPLDEEAARIMPFAWVQFNRDDPQASRGLFQTDTILATLATHYKAVLGSGVDEHQLAGYFPVGALALAAAAVHRAFDRWRSGVESKGGKNFDESNYGAITAQYATPISTISDVRRDRIVARARAIAFPAMSSSATAAPETASWQLIEQDSEDEAMDE